MTDLAVFPVHHGPHQGCRTSARWMPQEHTSLLRIRHLGFVVIFGGVVLE